MTPDVAAFKAEVLKMLKEDWDADAKLAEQAVANAESFIIESYHNDELDAEDVAEAIYDDQYFWDGDQR